MICEEVPDEAAFADPAKITMRNSLYWYSIGDHRSRELATSFPDSTLKATIFFRNRYIFFWQPGDQTGKQTRPGFGLAKTTFVCVIALLLTHRSLFWRSSGSRGDASRAGCSGIRQWKQCIAVLLHCQWKQCIVLIQYFSFVRHPATSRGAPEAARMTLN